MLPLAIDFELRRRQFDRRSRDGGLPVRCDLEQHELIPAPRGDRTHPMRGAEIADHGAGRGDVLHKR